MTHQTEVTDHEDVVDICSANPFFGIGWKSFIKLPGFLLVAKNTPSPEAKIVLGSLNQIDNARRSGFQFNVSTIPLLKILTIFRSPDEVVLATAQRI
ncbi:MAG: hypothetical protein H6629_19285 [Calditrichae bacterium]|nr:hypothetical protein [Calditrichia bacterium]